MRTYDLVTMLGILKMRMSTIIKNNEYLFIESLSKHFESSTIKTSDEGRYTVTIDISSIEDTIKNVNGIVEKIDRYEICKEKISLVLLDFLQKPIILDFFGKMPCDPQHENIRISCKNFITECNIYSFNYKMLVSLSSITFYDNDLVMYF